MRRLGDWSEPSVRRITPTSRVNHSDPFKVSYKKMPTVFLLYDVINMHSKVFLENICLDTIASWLKLCRSETERLRSVRDSESVVLA